MSLSVLTIGLSLATGAALASAAFLLRMALRPRGDVVPPDTSEALPPAGPTAALAAETAWAARLLSDVRSTTSGLEHSVGAHQQRVGAIEREMLAAAPDQATLLRTIQQIASANGQLQTQLSAARAQIQEQSRTIESYADAAFSDALTGLANRRAFDHRLAECQTAWATGGPPWSVLLIDLDEFKRFNDQHGHAAGDEVLRRCGRALRESLCECDLVARYGGEEFAALAVGPGTADLPAAAESARQAIALAPIAWHGRQLHVTASFGGAPSIGGEVAEQAVERADRALYASKAAGRNCTHWCDGTDAPRLVPQRGPAEGARADRGTPIGSRAAPAEPILAQAERPTGGASSDALLDAETGLPTRMALVHELRRRLAERRRLGGDVAVLLMELTDLAHRGHGPAAARQGLPALVGTLLKANAREMDLAARYGAARFALLLPGATLDEALAASRRLRAALVVYDDVRVRLLPRRCRWRGGLAVARDDDDAAVLLRRAETALRAAAIAGRDQVYVHDGVTCAAADEGAVQPA